MKKKIALLLACVMAFGIAVGGTLAWLTDTTEEVKNTFTPSTINIELTETFNKDTDNNNVADAWEKKMVPGATLDKDPKVTVNAGSEACWLFVKVEKSANFDTYMTCAIDSDWTALGANYPGVYWRAVDAATAQAGNATNPYAVLDNNQVQVKTTVTKAMMDALTTTNYPTLTFTAYAIQQASFADAAAAWAEISAT